MIQSSEYKQSVLIQTLTVIQDDIGQEIEQWNDLMKCRARINTYKNKDIDLAGEQRASINLSVDVRYCKLLSDIKPFSTRIIYNGNEFNIVEIDDYMQNHETIRMTAVCNNG